MNVHKFHKYQRISMIFASRSGQAITEVIIGLTVSAIIVAVVGAAIALILRSNQENAQFQAASLLAQEYADAVQVIAEGNWHALYGLHPKTATSTFRVATSGAQYVVQSGTSSLTVDGIQYIRYFSLENVSRDGSNNIEATYASANDDPSTQKVTVYVEWTRQGARRQTSSVKYLARWQNKVTRQSDWGGGGGQEDPLASPDNRFSTSTNIDTSSSTGSIMLEGY